MAGPLQPGQLPPQFPHAQPYAQSFLEISRGDLVQVSKAAAADGLMQVLFDPVPIDKFWFIDRLAISTTSTTLTRATVYNSQLGPRYLLSSTLRGNLDYDDTDTPYRLGSQEQLLIQWDGASVGAIATCAMQYRLMGLAGSFV